jgi:hypothetical protein
MNKRAVVFLLLAVLFTLVYFMLSMLEEESNE